MPDLIATYTNALKLEPFIHPDDARWMAGRFIASTTFTKGQTVGIITTAGATQGQLKAYASGSSDGSQVPVGWVMFDFVTDASGNVIFGNAGSVADIWRGSHDTAPYYYKGNFLYADLSGMDANAITVMKLRDIGVGGVAGGSTGRIIIAP